MVDHRDPYPWEKRPTVLEQPDEAIIALGGCLVIGTLTLILGLFIVTFFCSVGAFLTGRHLVELAEDGQRYRALGRATKGRICGVGDGRVDVLVDPNEAKYPISGRRCRVYEIPDDDV